MIPALADVDVDGQMLSPDSKYVSYMYTQGGSDWSKVGFWDIKANKTSEIDELKWIKFSHPRWLRDGRGVLYSRHARPA